MHRLRLAPLLLLALVAVLLAGCGSETSSRNAQGAWTAANDAAQSFAANGPKYALALQDCTNTAQGNAAGAACAKEALANVADAWAPVGVALTALDKVGSKECQAAVAKAVSDAHLIDGHDTSPPSGTQGAEALTTQITNAILQFSQELAGAQAACV
jgi:hypothetical protein